MIEAEAQRASFDATRELRIALRRLKSPAQLQDNPLARTGVVRARAAERHTKETFPEGLALRELLIETMAEVDRELAAVAATEDPVETKKMRLVLRGLARGEGVAAVGRSIGITPGSHSARMLYRVQHLLVRQFLQRAGQMAPAYLERPPQLGYRVRATDMRSGRVPLAG